MPFLASHPWHPRRSRKGPGWKLLVEPKMSPRIVRKPIFSSLGRPLFHRTQGHFWDANPYPFLAPKRVPEIVPLWKQVRATILGPNLRTHFWPQNPSHFWPQIRSIFGAPAMKKTPPRGRKKRKKMRQAACFFSWISHLNSLGYSLENAV